MDAHVATQRCRMSVRCKPRAFARVAERRSVPMPVIVRNRHSLLTPRLKAATRQPRVFRPQPPILAPGRTSTVIPRTNPHRTEQNRTSPNRPPQTEREVSAKFPEISRLIEKKPGQIETNRDKSRQNGTPKPLIVSNSRQIARNPTKFSPAPLPPPPPPLTWSQRHGG